MSTPAQSSSDSPLRRKRHQDLTRDGWTKHVPSPTRGSVHRDRILHTIACFRSSAPKKTKTENARPKNNNKSHYISIKTHGTGTKLYNTSQLYLSISLIYPMWGNTHYSMFSFFGSEKNENRNRERPQNNKVIISLSKDIRNWDKTLQYLPIVFIDTTFLPM